MSNFLQRALENVPEKNLRHKKVDKSPEKEFSGPLFPLPKERDNRCQHFRNNSLERCEFEAYQDYDFCLDCLGYMIFTGRSAMIRNFFDMDEVFRVHTEKLILSAAFNRGK